MSPEPTDPNLLYNAAARLDEFGVIDREEAAAFTAAFLGLSDQTNAALYARLDPGSSGTRRWRTTTRARRSAAR